MGPAGGFQAHDVAATLPDGSIFGVTWLNTPGLSGAAENGQALLDAIVAHRSGTGQILSQRPLISRPTPATNCASASPPRPALTCWSPATT